MLATSPITVTTGASRPSRSAAAAMVASVAIVTRWSGVVADWMHAAGVCGVAPRRDQIGGEPRQSGPSHQHHDGIHADEWAQVGRRPSAGLVRGHHGERPRHAARRHRNPRGRRSRDRAGDAGHHLARHARRAARRQLLAPPAEHERIAALEPDDRAAAPRARSTSSALISSCVSAACPRPLPTSISSAPGPRLLQQLRGRPAGRAPRRRPVAGARARAP